MKQKKNNTSQKPWIRSLWMIGVLLILLLSVGCSSKNEIPVPEEGQYYTYYVNSSGTALISRIYEAQAQDTQELIEELLEQCRIAPVGGDGRKAIPGNVVISMPPELHDRIVNIYFDTTYTTMDKVTELLCKAAMAKTITQLEKVDFICIYVNGEVYKGSYFVPSTDDEAELPGTSNQLGEEEELPANSGNGTSNPLAGIVPQPSIEKTLWSGADFLDNTGDDTNKYQQAELTLYFANGEGKQLVAETREVVYSSTLSMERVVLNQLIEGPKGENLTATLPRNLKIQGVSLRDGVCHVDFDASFLEEPVNVTDQVEIYSIVNSLTHLNNVMQVQITINGSADAMLRNNISLSGRFEKDLSMIQVPQEWEPEPESTEPVTEPVTESLTETTGESAEEQTTEDQTTEDQTTEDQTFEEQATEPESTVEPPATGL